METKKDWTVADKDGNISVPDRLDNLLNRMGFQLRLVTVSGLNEIECLARMVKGADEHSKKEAIKFADWIKEIGWEKYKEGWCQAGGSNGWHCTTEELYEKYIETAVAVTEKNAK